MRTPRVVLDITLGHAPLVAAYRAIPAQPPLVLTDLDQAVAETALDGVEVRDAPQEVRTGFDAVDVFPVNGVVTLA